MLKLGVEQLLADPDLLGQLQTKNIGLVAHPASVTQDLTHSLDVLMAAGVNICCAFGPQHGMRGDKQDNMIESADFADQRHGIPVYSLYGKHREPTAAMLSNLDVILFDLQDIGCRIYTYITTLKYFMEACEKHRISLWILDRPNPAGRPVDGLTLEPDQESFVGCDHMPTRHGLTVGELGQWMAYKNHMRLDLHVVAMPEYDPTAAPGHGWPQLSWVNPSPNASSVNMARCFPGTVLIEGTTLSEGRGTTIPLEVVGAPGLDIEQLLKDMALMAPEWMAGVTLRPCYFEPTFHKYSGELCHGFQIHTDVISYQHEQFRPFQLIALFLKCLRNRHRDYPLWRYHEYEYEPNRTPIDIINGGSYLRQWVDDIEADIGDMAYLLERDANWWLDERKPHLLYPA